MANKFYEEEHIKAIADAIRESHATDQTYKVSEMADVIRQGGIKFAIKETTTEKVIRDSAEYRMLNMKVYGHSWQKTTEGHQLLNIDNISTQKCDLLNTEKMEFQSNVNDDYMCQLLIKDDVLFEKILNSKGKYLHFSVKNNHGKNISIVLFGITNDGTKTYEEDMSSNKCKLQIPNELIGIDVLIEVRFNRNGAITHTDTSTVFSELMLYIGDEDDDYSFEPYTHGATPNPYYPQPIESATKVKVLGGNYFNINNFVNQDDGVAIRDNGFEIKNTQGEGHPNGVWSVTLGQLCPDLRDGDEVYLNMDIVNPSGINEFYLYGSGRDWINGTSLVITQADLDGNFNVYGSYGTTTIYKNIVVSKEPIPFEPYKEPQTLELPTLREGDYISYDDRKLTRCSDEYVFTGEEEFDDLIESYDAITTRFPHKSASPYLCTHAITDDTSGSYWANDNNLAFCASAFGVSSVEEFKNVLREKYNSDMPCKIVYQLVEPIETDLTDEQIAGFHAIHMNYPTTTIIGDAEITYVADPENYKAQH